MNFEPGIAALKAEYGYWTTAVKRFIREGMEVFEELPGDIKDNGTVSGAERIDPASTVVIDRNMRANLDLDTYPAKFPFDMSPRLPERVIEDHDEYRIFTDKYGITKKERKTGTSTPLEIEYPVKSRNDFHAYKEYYSDDYTTRLPKNWDRLTGDLKDREYAIRLGGFPFGFFGFPRHLIGTKDLYLLMYDDPGLIKEVNEFFLNFAMDYWDKIITAIQPDFVLIWEDMAGKTGSLISNEMFREFMTPYYLRFIDYFKQYGIKNIHVDSDGYIEDLLPLWVEVGVTGMFPFERQAGNDILRIRKDYPKFQILGGVDKRVFTAEHTFEEIDKELEVIGELLKTGGYIPHADHHVPDDACWKNFKYYRLRLNDLIDKTV